MQDEHKTCGKERKNTTIVSPIYGTPPPEKNKTTKIPKRRRALRLRYTFIRTLDISLIYLFRSTYTSLV